MGPSNVALVKLFQADQKLREAQERLDAVSKNVRVQERKVHDLAERLRLSQQKMKEEQSHLAQFDLDVKTRDAQIERLRVQQQSAKNDKEYKTFIVEINTQKVDKGKIEEQMLKTMQTVETLHGEVKELSVHVESETGKLTVLRGEIGDKVAAVQAEIAALQPGREEAAAAVAPRTREAFTRLCERYDGEALSPLRKPDYRREEYNCTACNMDLVTDVYNKLHSRDELVFCPSCGRMLYIPDELPPELAVGRQPHPDAEKSDKPKRPRAKKKASPKPAGEVVITPDMAPSPKDSPLEDLLRAAQGESVKGAFDAEAKPVECEVFIDDKSQGEYKGKSAEHLERVIRFRMEEAHRAGAVKVTAKVTVETTAPVAGMASTAGK